MAYVQVSRSGQVVCRRPVDAERAHAGCRVALEGVGEAHLSTGQSSRIGDYQVSIVEGPPPPGGESGLSAESLTVTFTRSPEPRTPQDEAAAPIVEGYEIIRLLGEGGMGAVWRAVQLSTGREVALKLLGAGRFGSDRARGRFEREVELSARLEHPNIARVYDSGLRRGVYCYAMELIDGVHLDRYVPQHGPGRRRVLQLVGDVCRAVQHAHQNGVIHRDLKPSNILVTADGQPHVLDFGLAKTFLEGEDRPAMTMDGDLAGTPAYMSPEQAAGWTDRIDTRSDVYSLGVILYRLLTGRPPHDLSGSRLEVLQRIVQEDARRPRGASEDIDAELEALLLKALSRDPAGRYASAGELARDIDNYLAGEPLIARKPTTLYILRKRLWKHRARVAAAALALVVLLGLAGYSYVRIRVERNYAEVQRAKAVDAAAETAQQREALREMVRKTQERLIRRSVANGWQLHDEGDLTGALLWHVEALRLAREVWPDAPARAGAEVNHRIRIRQVRDEIHEPRAIFLHDGSVLHAAFSPDGKRVATASWDRTARIWDARTGRPVTPPLRHREKVLNVAFSPDGSRVVTAGMDNHARIWDAATGKPTTPMLRTRRGVFHVAFGPQGKRVASASEDGATRLWDARTGRPLTAVLPNTGWQCYVAFSPDGSRIVTGGGAPRVWDARTGRPVTGVLAHTGGVLCAAFGPEGRRVLTAGADGTARLWDAATGRPLTPPLKHEAPVSQAAFSPDGKALATASADKTARLWDARTGQPLAPPLAHNKEVRCAAFSPDGARLVTAGNDGTVYIWDSGSGTLLSRVIQHGQSIHSVCFSPDGKWLLTASRDNTARIWSAEAGRPRRRVLHAGSLVRYAAFDPAGERLVTCGGDNAARLWDARTGRSAAPPLRHQAGVWHAAFSPRGDRLVTAALDGTAGVWDARTGAAVTPLLVHPAAVGYATFSPDGRQVLTASADRAVRVWDARSGNCVWPAWTHAYVHEGLNRVRLPWERFAGIGDAAFSPDGRRVVTRSEAKAARVWDVKTGQPVTPPLQHGSYVLRAEFSPDGRRVATAGQDKAARIWDAASGRLVAGPLRHTDDVYFARFTPDGRRVVTGSRDATARIWDAETGRPTTAALPHEGRVWHAAFSPCGRRVATACWGKTARIWDVETGKAVTPILSHTKRVWHVAFSRDGRRLVTASEGGTIAVWDARTGQRVTRPLVRRSEVFHVAMDPDGTRLVAAGRGAVLWELVPDDSPIEGLTQLAQLLSSRRLDETGGVIPLSAEEIQHIWRRVKDNHPDVLSPGQPAGALRPASTTSPASGRGR